MADNDVKIKVSMEGDKVVIDGLTGIGEAAGSTDSKLGSLVRGGLKGAGAAFLGFAAAAAAGGVALGAAVTNAYASAEQSVGGIETLFKNSADKMKGYAAEAYATAGLSANEYMEQATSMSAALIQSVGGDTAKAAELANTALISMSDNANKMGTDLASIQNAFGGFAKGNFTMLDNLKLGYGGTQEEMARLLADAEKLPAAMGQKFDMSNYGDVVTAIQLIQEEMGIAGTTAQEASSTISGSVGMLKGSFDNLLVAMGSANNESLAFLDVQQQAANVVSSLETVIGNVTPVIESIGQSMGTLGPQLGSMAQTLVGAISSAIPAILQAGVALIQGLISGISSALPSLVDALIPGVVDLVNSLSGLLPLFVDAGAQAVVALVSGLAESAPMIITSLVEAVMGMVDSVIQALPLLLEAGIQLVMGLAEGIMQSIPIILEMLPELINGIVNFIVTGVPMLMQAAIQLFNGIIQALPLVIAQLLAVLPTLITAIMNALIGAVPLIIQTGIKLLTSLIGALPQIITTIVAALPKIITAVVNAVLGAIPVLIEAGIDLFIALIGALPQIISVIIGAIPQIISSVVRALVNSAPQIMSAGVKVIGALAKGFPQAMGTILTGVGTVLKGIINAIKNGISGVVSVGGDLVRGIWTGISGAAGWLWDKIKGFAGQAVDVVKGWFGINSPSKVMSEEVGAWIPPGIGVGIDHEKQKAIQPIKDLGSEMVEEAQRISAQATLNVGGEFTQRLIPMQATPTQTNSMSPLYDLLNTPTEDVVARMSPADMDLLASKVYSALVRVRAEDGRDSIMAIKTGVR